MRECTDPSYFPRDLRRANFKAPQKPETHIKGAGKAEQAL